MIRRTSLCWLSAALITLSCSAKDSELDSALAASSVTANGLSAVISFSSQSSAGYCADVALTNVGSTTITTWDVQIELAQTTMTSGWSATFAMNGSRLVAKPLSWNATLAPGAKTSFGFCASAPSASARPSVAP